MAGSTTNYGLTKPATGEAYDINIPNNNMDIIDTELKKLNDTRAKGIMARLFDAATSQNFNSTEGLVNYVQVALVAGRWYRVDFKANVISAGANQPMQIFIKKDTDTAATTTFATGGTISNISSVNYPETGPSTTLPFTVEASVAFEATVTETVLIKVSGKLQAAGTNFTWTQRALEVYDEGDNI